MNGVGDTLSVWTSEFSFLGYGSVVSPQLVKGQLVVSLLEFLSLRGYTVLLFRSERFPRVLGKREGRSGTGGLSLSLKFHVRFSSTRSPDYNYGMVRGVYLDLGGKIESGTRFHVIGPSLPCKI